MKSGNQEQVCLKLDGSVYEQLLIEAMVTGKPKNRIINDGVLIYTNIARLRREFHKCAISENELLEWMKTAAFGKVADGGRV